MTPEQTLISGVLMRIARDMKERWNEEQIQYSLYRVNEGERIKQEMMR